MGGSRGCVSEGWREGRALPFLASLAMQLAKVGWHLNTSAHPHTRTPAQPPPVVPWNASTATSQPAKMLSSIARRSSPFLRQRNTSCSGRLIGSGGAGIRQAGVAGGGARVASAALPRAVWRLRCAQCASHDPPPSLQVHKKAGESVRRGACAIRHVGASTDRSPMASPGTSSGTRCTQAAAPIT